MFRPACLLRRTCLWPGLLTLILARVACAQDAYFRDPFLKPVVATEAYHAAVETAGWSAGSAGAFAPTSSMPWTWQLLPDDLLFRSYLGAPREPRLTSAWLYDSDSGWLWELEAGTRVGLLRYGSPAGASPEGWQLDFQTAAFPRLNIEHNNDLDSVDFEVGVPLTWRRGPMQAKIELRHVSAHVGDEFLARNPGFIRVNYVRNSVVVGAGIFPTPDVRLYAEADYAFSRNGGAEPWHLQFGIDYSPAPVTEWLGWHGTPFAAVSGRLREEADFGGGLNAVAGWQFRGPDSDRLFRIGLQYYNGKSLQYSFFDEHEELLGAAIWYDY